MGLAERGRMFGGSVWSRLHSTIANPLNLRPLASVVDLEFPKVEVRFQDLCVDAFVLVGSKALPIIPNFIFNITEVSFVNSIATIKGGTHVDYVTNQITNYVMSIVNKKNKNANLKAHTVKIHLWVFFLKKVSKSGIVESLLSWADFKQSKDLKKTDGTKRQRITGITKLEDANDAGGKSSDKCTLILTEGVSAKALAMAGISVVGRNYYGVFPLRGKLLNVREASHKQIMENAEIQSIKQILGLQHGKQYDSVKTLRYGHLMIMTDQVKHSRTSSPSSYEKDFCELVDIHTRKKRRDKKKHNVMLQDLEHDSDNSSNTSNDSIFEADKMSLSFLDNIVDDSFSENDDDVSSSKANQSTASNEKKLSVEYLEDECDLLMGVDDLDVSCGEFFGQSPDKDSDICGLHEINDPPNKREEGLKLQQGHLEGSTIIYVPTRKETLSIPKFLCKCGVKAAAYNAKLPRSHLR
ncbi:unnamed protein product [Camellia sinensis]